jgi:predicted nucleic acid-binding protein
MLHNKGFRLKINIFEQIIAILLYLIEIAMRNETSYYDSLFLAAAQEEEMPLLTLDRKRYEKAKANIDVRLV